jgi:hypothetical protein
MSWILDLFLRIVIVVRVLALSIIIWWDSQTSASAVHDLWNLPDPFPR